MSEAEKTNRPKAGEKLSPLGYHMRVAFHPEVRLEPNKGWDFGKALSEFIQPNKSDLKEEAWTFSQPHGDSPHSSVSVTVQTSSIEFDVLLPNQKKEWYETRYGVLLNKFAAFFEPRIILASSAMIHGTMQVDGDARTFLARHVMNIEEDRPDV